MVMQQADKNFLDDVYDTCLLYTSDAADDW